MKWASHMQRHWGCSRRGSMFALRRSRASRGLEKREKSVWIDMAIHRALPAKRARTPGNPSASRTTACAAGRESTGRLLGEEAFPATLEKKLGKILTEHKPGPKGRLRNSEWWPLSPKWFKVARAESPWLLTGAPLGPWSMPVATVGGRPRFDYFLALDFELSKVSLRQEAWERRIISNVKLYL
jgi:hypothetical protein